MPAKIKAKVCLKFGISFIASAAGISAISLEKTKANEAIASTDQIAQLQLNPSATFGILPRGSGGLSFPETPTIPEINNKQQQTSHPQYIWPTKGVFTSGYGWRWGRMHRGIDIANNTGTPILAAADGTITYSRWNDGGFGYLVEIQHSDGTLTLYAHNSRLLVSEGDFVRQGQVIAQMGSTGRSTGPHLHFEIRPAGKQAVDPLQFVQPPA
jgi:murein DD-endopeptidase MepM/ murein hydrolase activator NlpD